MGEGIIDIRQFLDPAREARGRTFSVWGGDGEKARFSLPVWRALFLVGGDRGGIFHSGGGDPEEVVPFFVLDLGREPARTAFRRPPPEMMATDSPPRFVTRSDGHVVFLGEGEGRRWFLEVGGGEEGRGLVGNEREELLFLAGECAGLLFLRHLASGTE